MDEEYSGGTERTYENMLNERKPYPDKKKKKKPVKKFKSLDEMKQHINEKLGKG